MAIDGASDPVARLGIFHPQQPHASEHKAPAGFPPVAHSTTPRPSDQL